MLDVIEFAFEFLLHAWSFQFLASATAAIRHPVVAAATAMTLALTQLLQTGLLNSTCAALMPALFRSERAT